MKAGERYRVIKTKDHQSPWSESFVVFDTSRSNSAGMFEYVADCVDSKAAKLVADALNAHCGEKPARRKKRA